MTGLVQFSDGSRYESQDTNEFSLVSLNGVAKASYATQEEAEQSAPFIARRFGPTELRRNNEIVTLYE